MALHGLAGPEVDSEDQVHGRVHVRVLHDVMERIEDVSGWGVQVLKLIRI